MQTLSVHGSIYTLFHQFVETNYDGETWEALKSAAHVGHSYDSAENYPASELTKMIAAASRLTGESESTLKESFGEFMAPHLLSAHKDQIDPGWKTYEMLLHTEGVMHTAVRADGINATPPVLHVSHSGHSLIIDYFSRRRMASLAIGIIRGIARHFNEEDVVKVIPRTDPKEERVQIKVEFHNR